MPETYSPGMGRVRPHELGSCPRCRRLVTVCQLATHAVGWPPVHSGPIPPGRETRTTVLVWEVHPKDREDYTRLVGARAVEAQGFGDREPGRLTHECTAEVLGLVVVEVLDDGTALVELSGGAA
jgi:hypothetical protein